MLAECSWQMCALCSHHPSQYTRHFYLPRVVCPFTVRSLDQLHSTTGNLCYDFYHHAWVLSHKLYRNRLQLSICLCPTSLFQHLSELYPCCYMVSVFIPFYYWTAVIIQICHKWFIHSSAVSIWIKMCKSFYSSVFVYPW